MPVVNVVTYQVFASKYVKEKLVTPPCSNLESRARVRGSESEKGNVVRIKGVPRDVSVDFGSNFLYRFIGNA